MISQPKGGKEGRKEVHAHFSVSPSTNRNRPLGDLEKPRADGGDRAPQLSAIVPHYHRLPGIANLFVSTIDKKNNNHIFVRNPFFSIES